MFPLPLVVALFYMMFLLAVAAVQTSRERTLSPLHSDMFESVRDTQLMRRCHGTSERRGRRVQSALRDLRAHTQPAALLMLNVSLTWTMLPLWCLVCTVCNEIVITRLGLCMLLYLYRCVCVCVCVCVRYTERVLFDTKQCRAFIQTSAQRSVTQHNEVKGWQRVKLKVITAESRYSINPFHQRQDAGVFVLHAILIRREMPLQP